MRIPVDWTIIRLAGAPVSDHTNGLVPVAVNVTFTVEPRANIPGSVLGHCTVGGVGLLTVIVNCGDTAVRGGLLESCTCTTNMNVPAARAVPEIAPVLDRIMPDGNCPLEIEKESGGVPPDVLIVAPA